MKTYKCEHCNDIMNEDDDVWETFEDEILCSPCFIKHDTHKEE